MTQDQAVKILKTGKNVFLTGQPGSGKTYTINQYIEYLTNQGEYPAITASTGIAATHIGGTTIHSWAGIGIEESLSQLAIEDIAQQWWIQKRISGIKVLIIDEVSMLPAHVLDLVDRVCRQVRRLPSVPFGGIQVILVGDLFQLPPVTKNGAEVAFAYKSKVWNELNLQYCVLHEQHRQEDMKFLKVLTAMRNGTLKPLHVKQLKARMNIKDKESTTRLFTHNADVDILNVRELKAIDKPIHTYLMKQYGNPKLLFTLKKNCLSPEKLELKEGALVMFTRNNMDEGYVNGTLGKVSYFEKNGDPVVLVGKKEIIPKSASWSIKERGVDVAEISQIPLRLAWAMTVHKSQGMSLDSAIIDLGKSFEYGQGYVALSRVRSLAGLFLEGLNEQALMMHPEIVEKDKEFVGASLLLEKSFQ